MLSIQEGRFRAQLADYTGETAEIMSNEEFLEGSMIKTADSARNRGR
ncbi:MAG: hypothetical protein LBU32_33360 [Clostridiales bacterium]|jgi:hypothetical protein|nr:hypothetical protein [Clostridiales bacterium]